MFGIQISKTVEIVVFIGNFDEVNLIHNESSVLIKKKKKKKKKRATMAVIEVRNPTLYQTPYRENSMQKTF